MDPSWKEAFKRLPYGIYVLTTRYQDDINAMIASWVSQVSYSPPLVMAAVHVNRYAHGLVEKGGAFALHLLEREQGPVLSNFKGHDPLAGLEALGWDTGKTSCPLLKSCIAYMECELRESYRPGNHTLFIGSVVDARSLSEGPPLTTLDIGKTYLGEA